MFKTTLIIILALFVKAMPVVVCMPKLTTTSYTEYELKDLKKYWYILEKCRAASYEEKSTEFFAYRAYWGLYAVRNDPSQWRIDTLGIAVYYKVGDDPYRFYLYNSDGEFKNDVELIRQHYNGINFYNSKDYERFDVGNPTGRRDSLASYIRLYTYNDSVYVILAIPNSNMIKIYKNDQGPWVLKKTFRSSQLSIFGPRASLLHFKKKSSKFYLLDNLNKNLYEFNPATFDFNEIATNLLGYFLDNENGLWLTNSLGELSYLKNSIKTIVKKDSIYAQSIFSISPVDTTFFYGRRIQNSYYGNQEINVASSTTSINAYLDKNNNIVNRGCVILTKSRYKYYVSNLTRGVDYIEDETGEILRQTSNTTYLYKINYPTIFYDTKYPDSLGHINESKMICYSDALKAFNHSNEDYTFSLIENPIGIALVGSIFYFNKNLPEGTYTTKFRVADNNYSDTLSWTLNIYSRKISIIEYGDTLASEGLEYKQTITTKVIDNDSSYIYSLKIPSWLSIKRTNKNQFEISGTPRHESQDTTIEIIVTDSSMYFDSLQNYIVAPTYDTLNYSIKISKTNKLPVFTSKPITTGYKNKLYAYQVIAIDDEPLTYSILGPTGITISQNGLVSWIPTDTGRFVIAIKATDTFGLYQQHNYVVTILNSNFPPKFITVTSDTTITETDSLMLTAIATDSNGTIPTISWYLENTLISQGNSYKLRTDYSSAGIKIFKVVASDGEFSVEHNITITIADKNRLPIIPNDTLVEIKLNEVFKLSVRALDLDGDSLLYYYDTTKLNVSNMVVEIIDSNYYITLKKEIKDTLIVIISDGKENVYVNVIVVPKLSTFASYAQTTFKNSYKIKSDGSIQYSIAKKCFVSLFIYSINGNMIYRFNDNAMPGVYNKRINVAPGTYVCRFSIGKDFSETGNIKILR